MKIVLSRDGYVKSQVNTGCQFNDDAAIKFLAEVMENKSSENKEEIQCQKHTEVSRCS